MNIRHEVRYAEIYGQKTLDEVLVYAGDKLVVHMEAMESGQWVVIIEGSEKRAYVQMHSDAPIATLYEQEDA